MKRRHGVALAVLLSVVLLTLNLVTRHSDAYDRAMRFVSRDTRVSSLIGAVHRVEFRFWHGFTYTGHDADFSFRATSGQGSFIVDVRLRHKDGAWRVQDADILSGNGSETDLLLH